MAETVEVRDSSKLTAREFHQEIVPRGQPIVLRNIAADWPVTHAGKTSAQALSEYLLKYDRGQPARAMIGSPRSNGRFFYNEEVTGFNFRTESIRLDAALDMLLDSAEEPLPTPLAIQSLQLWEALPGFDQENRLALLPASVEPRAWLGNRVVVAAHYDPSENLACVVAGKRHFTLFPPDQVENLYPGPFELTPAGPTISMVDFDAPNFDRFPRFRTALDHARDAQLEPGDAIYIPYLWWHHVRSTEPVNLLINYWWSSPSSSIGHPMEALVHAITAIRSLPPNSRKAWEAMFRHYVFNGEPIAAHLPVGQQGILGQPPSGDGLAWAQQLLASRYRKT